MFKLYNIIRNEFKDKFIKKGDPKQYKLNGHVDYKKFIEIMKNINNLLMNQAKENKILYERKQQKITILKQYHLQ